MKTESRSELERLFKELTDLRFPPSGRNEETRDLHGLLILYDADVAAAVMKVLAAPKPQATFNRLPGLQEDEKLRQMIEKLVKEYPPNHEIGQLVRKHANYYETIKKVILAARTYINSSN